MTVLKSQSRFLLVVALYDDSGRYTNIDVSDFIASKLQDPISRVSGVGQVQCLRPALAPCASGSIPSS